MHAAPSRLKANLLLLLATAIWGSAFIAQSVVSRYPFAFLHNGLSFLGAALVLFPFVRKRAPLTRDSMRWMGICGALLFAGAAFQQVGLAYTTVSNAGFLTSLYVVFTPLVLFLFFGEKPGRLELLAVIFAVVGAFFLSTGGTFASGKGDILQTIGALFWGLHIVSLSKRASLFEPFSFAAGQFFVCGVLSIAVGLCFESPQVILIPEVALATLYRGLLSTTICFTIQVWAQRFTSPTEAALIFALESVFAAGLGWALLGEQLLYLQIAGCVLILASAALSQIR